jgi:hypothetical protein
VQLVHRHLTSAMCEAVFRELRTKERARTWTLDAMARFWIAVVLRAPDSLREALEEAHGGRAGFPFVESTTSSFFERAQGMRWEFFDELFRRFLGSVLPETRPDFETALAAELPEFPELWAVDGTSLDRVAHRLKAVRGVRAVVIPGSVLAMLDLRRGVLRRVVFREKLLTDEVSCLARELDEIPKGTLLVMDRGFCSMQLLVDLGARGLHAAVRFQKSVRAQEIEVLSRFEDEGVQVLDRLVVLGSGSGGRPKVTARLIEKPLAGGGLLRLVVTVLDPAKLPARAALSLYRRRWAVERMFQELKQVLDLRRFYAANTNAVAMQVYACAIVHVALRVTQARIAREQKLAPEALSVAKLFPRVAAAHYRLLEAVEHFEMTRRANPRVRLVEPDWSGTRLYSVRLRRLLARKPTALRRSDASRTYTERFVSLQRYERRDRPPASGP